MSSARRAPVDYPRVEVRSRAELRAFLTQHHATSRGVWLVTYKQATGARHVPWSDVVDELLCFGWVDSRPAKLDEQRSMLLCTPRKPTSAWSGINKAKVERLTEAGRMHPAGLAAVERARANGRWQALDAATALREPADLTRALDTATKARTAWDGFPPSTRRAILEWIGGAKRDETRDARIAATVAKAARGERANQWRQPVVKPAAKAGPKARRSRHAP